MTDTSAIWWSPENYKDRRPFLQARRAVTRALRAWFEQQGFVEVETGVLQVSPGNETHLHAPAAQIVLPSGERVTRYFRTSPEFACKKLLAAGEEKIVEFARVFRDRERGDLHLPEFTMLEWYRAGASYEAVIGDCVALIAEAARTTGIGEFSFRGKTADPSASPEWLTVADAFERLAGIDLLSTVVGGVPDRGALATAASARTRIADDDTWSDIFSKVLVGDIEPALGRGQADRALRLSGAGGRTCARQAIGSARCRRFEIYACGVELANGFAELTDAREQRERFVQAMDEKERRYGERYPIDEDFIAAVAQMPPSSGVALGFDRLVMLAAGAQRVDQVVWTPPERVA